jgi:hypothetical protein
MSTEKELDELKRVYSTAEQDWGIPEEYTGRALGQLQAAAISGFGSSQQEISRRLAQAQPKPIPVVDLNVLYLDGKPLPDDWRGAHIDSVTLKGFVGSTNTFRWVVTFSSKWSKDSIALHLDANEFSGKEANRIAETYKEALNQRRVG